VRIADVIDHNIGRAFELWAGVRRFISRVYF